MRRETGCRGRVEIGEREREEEATYRGPGLRAFDRWQPSIEGSADVEGGRVHGESTMKPGTSSFFFICLTWNQKFGAFDLLRATDFELKQTDSW